MASDSLDIPALRALALRASEGPWELPDYQRRDWETRGDFCGGTVIVPRYRYKPLNCRCDDAAFIAAARNHWTQLLDEVERLLAELSVARTDLGKCISELGEWRRGERTE